MYEDPCYYPAVAIMAMMRILRDASLVLQHDLALQVRFDLRACVPPRRCAPARALLALI